MTYILLAVSSAERPEERIPSRFSLMLHLALTGGCELVLWWANVIFVIVVQDRLGIDSVAWITFFDAGRQGDEVVVCRKGMN
jgi:hypothetical protein